MNILMFFVNILCIKFCVSISNPNDKLRMIVEVVKSYDKPTSVEAKVCLESSEIKLTKMLAKLERPITIHYLRANETLKNRHLDNHLLILLDTNCADAEFFLNQASLNKMFSKSYRWLVLINGNGILAPEFHNINISVDSEVITAQQKENNNFILHTVYKINANTEWNTEYYGTWAANTGLNKSKDTMLSNVMRRRDLKGLHVTTSVVIGDNRTKTDLLGLGNVLVDTLSKSSFRCVSPLYDFLNASRRIIFSDTWGYPRNGTWNGMIGDLIDGKAELCGIITYITNERLHFLEYFIHPTPIAARFVFRQPPLSYQNNLYLLPFTTSVWMCTGAFVPILVAILYINTKWDNQKYAQYDEKKLDQTCLPATLSDITFFILCAVSQQGSSIELKGTIGRLTLFLVFLAFVFLYTSYSANIVVLLQSTSNQIRTLSDLLNSKLELGVEDVAYARYYFSTAYSASDPIKKAIFETKIVQRGKPNFMTIEEGVKAMQKRPFALHMNTGTGYKIVSALFQEHEKCGLQEIDYIENKDAWLCSQKTSPFNEMFKVGYYRLHEHGLFDRENRLIYAKKPACSVMGGSFGSVNMVDFYPVCLMLLYGMILAFLLLALEILFHRRQKKRSHRAELD